MITKISVPTKGFSDVVDLTDQIDKVVSESGIKEGMCLAFVPGSTAGITTIEYEDGAIQDLKDVIERMAPEDADYAHNAKWGDGNGFSHVRAAILGPSLAVPIQDGKIVHGTWQQIILVDFDNKPREREIIIQVI